MTRFVAVALAVAIGLAVALAPHASSAPDGLNRVAADHGFAKRAVDRNAASAKVARGVAAGGATLLVFAIGAGGAAVLRRAGPAGNLRSPVHRLDARVKLLGFVALTLAAVAAGPGAWPVWAACAAILTAVAVTARVPARVIARRAAVALPTVLLAAAFLPFVRDGDEVLALGPLSISDTGVDAFASASAKAALGTFGAVLLGATTSFPDVLRALERLRVPRLFVLVARVTWRYLFVVAGEVRRVRAALVSRGYRPRHALQAQALGGAAGALFVRAHARGERVHQAMLARGGGLT